MNQRAFCKPISLHHSMHSTTYYHYGNWPNAKEQHSGPSFPTPLTLLSTFLPTREIPNHEKLLSSLRGKRIIDQADIPYSQITPI